MTDEKLDFVNLEAEFVAAIKKDAGFDKIKLIDLLKLFNPVLKFTYYHKYDFTYVGHVGSIEVSVSPEDTDKETIYRTELLPEMSLKQLAEETAIIIVCDKGKNRLVVEWE